MEDWETPEPISTHPKSWGTNPLPVCGPADGHTCFVSAGRSPTPAASVSCPAVGGVRACADGERTEKGQGMGTALPAAH